MFTDLTLDKTGTAYTLVASSGTLTGATSTAFDVTNASGTHLVFTTQPSDVTAGVAITPDVVVTALDALNNTVISFTSNVTLALGTCPAGAALSGTPTVAASAGVATFNGLSVDKAGGCTLDASAATLSTVTSASFTVNAAAAASVLKVSGDNQTGSGGAALAQPLVVEVRDAFANPVPGATVDWATPSGGSLAPPSGPTGVNGQAQSVWTLRALGAVADGHRHRRRADTGKLLGDGQHRHTGHQSVVRRNSRSRRRPSAPRLRDSQWAAGAGGVSVDVTSQNTNLVSVTGSPGERDDSAGQDSGTA